MLLNDAPGGCPRVPRRLALRAGARGTRGQPPGASFSSIFPALGHILTHIDSLGDTLCMGSREILLLPRGARARNYSAASNPFALIPVIQARYSQRVVVQGGANDQQWSGIRWENILLPRGLERGFISPPPNLSLFAP